jgi:flagellar hook capping protein FlgD
MKKKNLLIAGIMVLMLSLMNQFGNAQTCTGDEVLMSKGCVCGYKKYQCQSKCARPNQIQSLLKQGWYFGECGWCCPVLTDVADPIPGISLSLTKTGTSSIQIYDATGRLVKTFTEVMQPGSTEINWDKKDDSGNAVSPGIYFVTVNVGNYSETKKISISK